MKGPVGNYSKVWVEHTNGVGSSAILCPYARDFCEHYHECDGNSDCYRDGKAVFDAVDKLIEAVNNGETQVAGILAIRLTETCERKLRGDASFRAGSHG